MRPPWLAAGSDSEEDSSSEEEIESSTSTIEKARRILADLTLDDQRLSNQVKGHQEDEKAISRLLSLSSERLRQLAAFFKARAGFDAEFQKADAAVAEKEKKAAEKAAMAELEPLKAQRKDAYQVLAGKEGQVAQEETGITLQIIKEVEKAADKTSLREEGDKETVNSLLEWVKELKNEKKVASDHSQSRISAALKVLELRDKAIQDFLSSKSAAVWANTDAEIKKILKEQADKNEAVRKKLDEESQRRQKDEEERQSQRKEAIRQLQKEQTKRATGKKKK